MTMIQNILDEYWDNFNKDSYPKNRRMKVLLDNITYSINGESIYFMINEVVRCFSKTHLEIGVLHGASLFSAAIYNENVRCIGIDNFDFGYFKGWTWGAPKVLREGIEKNIKKFNLPNIEIIEGDFREVIDRLFSVEPDLKIDTFYFDGMIGCKDDYDSLVKMAPHMSDNCIIMLASMGKNRRQTCPTNYIKDFLSEFSDFQLITTLDPFYPMKPMFGWKIDLKYRTGLHIITRGNIEQK